MLREAHISRLERRYGIPAEAARRLAEQGVLVSVDAAEIARLCGRRDPGEGGGILIRYPNAEEMFAVRLDVPRVHPGMYLWGSWAPHPQPRAQAARQVGRG